MANCTPESDFVYPCSLLWQSLAEVQLTYVPFALKYASSAVMAFRKSP